MRLIRLELNGFKSFAKKTDILFDRGMTAIVGPNGSGKSNIADSIRWVLGEQSARTLRGNKMEDVIFGGTATRKAMAYCEVVLVFENEDRMLPIDYAEVSIARRVYRSGESEYSINNTNCRLKDVHELLRDTGLGKEGYSIVGQGKVEEILSNKSGERRKAFEEAAGIMKYRVRKEEAERTLDNTRKNLTRIFDRLSEMEERIEPLSEQSETATSFLRFREELRDLEVNVFLYQHDRLSEKLKSIEEAVEQLSTELENTTGQRVALNEDCTRFEESERVVGDELSQLKTQLVSMTAGTEALSGDIKVLDERLLNSARERERLLQSISEIRLKRAEIEESLSHGDNSSVVREETANLLRTQLSDTSAQIMVLGKKIDDKEFDIDQLKNDIINAMNSAREADILRTRYDATINSYEQNITRLENSFKTTQTKQLELQEEFATENSLLAQLESDFKCAESTVLEVTRASNESAIACRRIEEQINKDERDFEGMRSKLNVMLDVKRQHEGYFASTRRLLEDAANGASVSKYIEGVVAEVIVVPKEYELAIEMTLGNSIQNIITQDEFGGRQILEYVRAKNYGRITVYPMATMQARSLSYDEERTVSAVSGYIGIASDLIDYDAKYDKVMQNLLGRTIVVENMESGSKINSITNRSLRIVTLDGDLFMPGGSMVGGSNNRRTAEVSILGRERACTEMLQSIDAKKKSLQNLHVQYTQAKNVLDSSSSRIGEVERTRRTLEIKLTQQRDKVDIIERQLEEVNVAIATIDEERSKIADDIDDIKAQMSQAQEVQNASDTDTQTSQDDVSHEQDRLSALRNEQGVLVGKQTDLKIRIAALEKEGDSLQAEKQRLSKELSAAMATIESYECSIVKYTAEETEILGKKAEIESSYNAERSSNDEVGAKCAELEEQRVGLQTVLSEARKKRDAMDETVSDLRERLQRQEMSKNKCELDLNGMLDKLWSEYELTYDNAQSLRHPIVITPTNIRVGELKQSIKDLGTISINAIDEYKMLMERYTESKQQYDDLSRAEADLVKLIDEMTDKMKANFTDKFALIRQNFMQVFTELFGGGAADLVLSDPNDILNCDIDIMAQIPGKKLQSLAPLSGGERALTAIALQFAILGLKPTAFCLLDEIDASLDEANVSRFADYIHAYAEKTQFILITHRKGSMEACNALYGVAQEEKGVSKVVSARISRIAQGA